MSLSLKKGKKLKRVIKPEEPCKPQEEIEPSKSELPTFSGFLGVNLKEQKEEKPFLPYLFLTNPKTEGYEPWLTILTDESERVLDTPYKISHVLTVPFVRCREGEEYSERCFPQKHSSFEAKSAEKYQKISDALGDDTEAEIDGFDGVWQRGVVHLVFLIEKSGKGQYITIECARSLENYWTHAFIAADLRKKRAAEIRGHRDSVVTSKKGFKYLASWKFKSWEPVDFTDTEFELAQEQWTKQAVQIENFLQR